MKTSIFISSVLLGSSLFAFRHLQSYSGRSTTVVSTAAHTHRYGNSFVKPVGTISVVIDKSDYELNVFDEQGWYATYPVVFGNNSLDDKKMEGDRQTPEGTFRIVSKRVHDKWNRFMALDYPNKESYDKFNKRKDSGEIPLSARIGGGIGIHGTWPHDDFMIDRYNNWTMGCISMKNSDVEEVYSFVPVGTRITIRK